MTHHVFVLFYADEILMFCLSSVILDMALHLCYCKSCHTMRQKAQGGRNPKFRYSPHGFCLIAKSHGNQCNNLYYDYQFRSPIKTKIRFYFALNSGDEFSRPYSIDAVNYQPGSFPDTYVTYRLKKG